MSTPFFALLKLHFKAMLVGLGLSGSSRKKRLSSAMVLGLLMVLFLYIGGSYGFMLQSMLSPVGGGALGICIMAAVSLILCFIFTMFSAQGVIFGHKDLDLLFSLPVSYFSILLSKILALYLENLITVLAMFLPSGIIYQVYNGFSGMFTFAFIISVIVLPLVSSLAALIVGFLLSWIRSVLLPGKIFNMIISFSAFGLLMYFVFTLQTKMFTLIETPKTSLISLYNAFWPFKLMGEFMFEGNIISAVLFILVCAVPFFGVCWLLSLGYRKIVTGVLAVRTQNKKYNLTSLKQSSVTSTLIKKELGRFFGTPILVFNSGFGLILLLAMPVLAIVFRESLLQYLAPVSQILPNNAFFAFIILVLPCFMGSTCYFSAVSVSLEGNTLWILKSLPIETKNIFSAKIAANLILSLIPMTICTFVCGLILGVEILTILLCILTSCLLIAFCVQLGLIINLLLPKLDALSDTAIVKQSASGIAGMFLSMIIIAAVAGLYFVFAANISFSIYFIAVSAVFVILNVITWLLLCKKFTKTFYALI